MRETQRSARELVADIVFGDLRRQHGSICEILSLSQNHGRMMELVRYRFLIRFAARRILSGRPHSVERKRLLRIFEIMDFHKKNEGCPCCLLEEEDDPHHVAEDGYFDLLQTVPHDPPCTVNDYYILRCKRCDAVYKVSEREYHSPWWEWQRTERS